MYRFLMVLTISAAVGLQGWRTLFNNFAVEVGGLEGWQIGVVQGVRELPGFLALLAIYLLRVVREHRLSVLSILCLGLGTGMTGLFPGFGGILLTTVVMSFGFHYYETTNQSLTLQYFDPARAPVVFGRQRAYAAAANIAVGLAIFAAAPVATFTQLYLAVGLVLAAIACWAWRQNPARPDLPLQRRRMVLRRRYWLFYLLTFLSGARRQIFMAFAVFLLVQRFGFTVRDITLLFVVNNAISYATGTWIGRAIVRFGERRMLSIEYASLVFVFLAYAVVESRAAAAALYLLDNFFFNFAIAIRTFFQKMADPRDIAPSMAVGFTINHIAAVALPVAGGALWMLDYRIPFLAGAGLSLCSLAAVQWIRHPHPDQG
jgi:predicted MFS family arabinose efflux permease